nr:lupus susceptibility protein p202 [Mus musculus]
MSNRNLRSSTNSEFSEGQHQTPSSDSSGHGEDQPQASPGPNKKSHTPKKNISKGAVLHEKPMTVMVLTATEPFNYKEGNENMFHATVATESQYYRVKVFNMDLKEKFTGNKFITISKYFNSSGILEFNETATVSEAAPNQMFEVPKNIIRSAKETLKISKIKELDSGTLIYGVFAVEKKKVNDKSIIFKVKDNEDNIKVVWDKEQHNINYEKGDKLQLFSFHLRKGNGKPILHSGNHSFIKGEKLLKESFEGDGYHKGPKQVVALKATKLFTYDSIKSKKMFHATVATDTEFFRVMVFEENLEKKFIPGNTIALSDYFGMYGSLAIHEYSSVSEVKSQNKEDSSSSDERPIEHLKICDLHLQTEERLVDGEFKVYRKSSGNNCICYGIWDDTGAMKVVVSGQLTSVNCEIGNTIRLVCFELTSNADEWFLRATRYSYMEVIMPEK